MRVTLAVLAFLGVLGAAHAQETRTYANRLTPIKAPTPLLADHAEFIEPIKELARFEAAALVDDEGADLHVRAWRFSYNARGIIEMPNRLRAAETVVIVVHPWGIDDGQGWKTPEPNGVCDFCTPAKIAVTLDLEMSRNFPTWDATHWDYEKGNLNDETKAYVTAACKRVKAAGGVVHCFAVGRTFEQESVAWLKDVAQAGHPIGNHTYDHVNV